MCLGPGCVLVCIISAECLYLTVVFCILETLSRPGLGAPDGVYCYDPGPALTWVYIIYNICIYNIHMFVTSKSAGGGGLLGGFFHSPGY